MNNFGKTVCKIAIPVTFQSMLQSSFSIIDQLMIGQLGENSIAAVGLGGNFMLIFSVVIGAIGTVAGILISQFIGADDEREAWRGFTVSNLFGIAVAMIFMLASFCFANSILGLYTTDAETIIIGTPYLRILSFTFIPTAISTVVATWLRCNEHATAISQMLNLLFMLAGFVYCLQKEKKNILFSIQMEKISMAEYMIMIMIMPILISEFLWSLGQNINSAVYGHIGTDSLAAYTLTCPIQGLFVGALSGLSAAAGVIIGKELGQKEYDVAYKDSKKLMWLGAAGSAVLSLVLIVASGLYVSFYQVAADVKSVAQLLLIVFAIYAPVKVINMILGGGIIRSGGNTKIIMIIDIVGTWLVGIPLCLFAAYVLKLSIVPVYAILSVEEIVRLVITLVMFKKKTWMRTIGES